MFEKFKKLGDSKELASFRTVCSTGFDVLRENVRAKVPQQLNSEPVDVVTRDESETETRVTRQLQRCSSCKRWCNRLHKELTQKQTNKKVTADLKKLQTVKVLNQKVKRKDEQINALKQELRKRDNERKGDNGDDKLQATQRKLAAVLRRERRLKQKVGNPHVLRFAQKECADAKEELQLVTTTLSQNTARIQDLEDENQRLQDEISSLLSRASEAFAKPSKAYPSETRLFVYDAIINQVHGHH